MKMKSTTLRIKVTISILVFALIVQIDSETVTSDSLVDATVKIVPNDDESVVEQSTLGYDETTLNDDVVNVDDDESSTDSLVNDDNEEYVEMLSRKVAFIDETTTIDNQVSTTPQESTEENRLQNKRNEPANMTTTASSPMADLQDTPTDEGFLEAAEQGNETDLEGLPIATDVPAVTPGYIQDNPNVFREFLEDLVKESERESNATPEVSYQGDEKHVEADFNSSKVPTTQRQRTPKITEPEEDDPIRYPYHPDTNQEKRPRINASKRDIVRSWLSEPYLRPPAAILIPLRVRPLARALAVWEDITKDRLDTCDILLIGYNNKGVSWMSRHNQSRNCSTASRLNTVAEITNTLKKLIHKYKSAQSSDHGDAVMHACVRASKLVPYDSALVVITDTRPSDGYDVSDATASLLVKRLKLYTIWTDPNKAKLDSDATTEMKKLSIYTQGEFIDYSLPIHLENEAYEEEPVWNSVKPLDVTPAPIRSETLFLHHGTGSNVFTFPVDGSMRTLEVKLDDGAKQAVLYTPNGGQIDLTKPQSVAAFTQDSRYISTSPLRVELALPGWEKRGREGNNAINTDQARRLRNVGVWRLAIRCDACEYLATVATLTPIAVEAFMLTSNVLRLRLRGPIGTVSEAVLIDEGGSQIVKLPFSHQSSNIGGSPDANTGIVADVPLPEMEPATMFVKIQGKDAQGNQYTRISEPVYKTQRARRSPVTFPNERASAVPNAIEPVEILAPSDDGALAGVTRDVLGRQTFVNTSTANGVAVSTSSVSQANLLTTVQIGLSSKLYGAPGDTLQIHFEVSNYRERNILFTFRATGNLRFLRGLRPTSQWISSGQTANVIVDVGITSSAANGAQDLITFTATGLDEVSLSAYVYVVTSPTVVYDAWIPELRYTIEGDCMFKTGENCNQHTWSANIYARDRDSGILRISSSPVGFRYDGTFISGSRESVSGTYRATCCNTRLVLSAVDSYANTNSYTIDVAYYIPTAVIVAIVLAVLLFLALIAIIVMAVYIGQRRNSDSRRFPSFATPSRRDGGVQ